MSENTKTEQQAKRPTAKAVRATLEQPTQWGEPVDPRLARL